MPQNLVYTPETAIETVRALASVEPVRTWRDFLFGWRRLGNLIRKTGYATDVFYVQTFEGKVPLTFAYSSKDIHGFGLPYSDESNMVDASGIRVYAVDPNLDVRGWSQRTMIGEKNSDRMAISFARDVAENSGKVAVISSQPSESQRGLFSIYFPHSMQGFLSEDISIVDSSDMFKTNLETALSRLSELGKKI